MTPHELKRLIVTIQTLRPELRRRYVLDRLEVAGQAEIGREIKVSTCRVGQIAARARWDMRPGVSWNSGRIFGHYRRKLEIALDKVGWPERDDFYGGLDGRQQ